MKLRLLLLLALLVASPAAGCGQGAAEPAPTTPAEAGSLPDVAQIECEVNGAKVLTTRVLPQPDGLHLNVENETGKELAFTIEESETGGQGASAPTGSVEYVWSIPPGKVFVKCTSDEADPSEVRGAELEVVDEGGLWVSTSLAESCARASMSTADYAGGAEGEKGDPVDIARRLFEKQGLEPGDVVEPAGYPEGDDTIIRVTRSGEVIATMSFLPDGTGGWLPENTMVCEAPPAFG